MNITFNFVSYYTMSFLKESILPSLTGQQKKIVIVASMAFGFLAACYIIANRCCFKAVPIENGNEDSNDENLKSFSDHLSGFPTDNHVENESSPRLSENLPETLILSIPTKGTKTYLECIFKEGLPEELIEFKATYPSIYQSWKKDLEAKYSYPFEIACSHKNTKIARYLARTEENIDFEANDVQNSTFLQHALVLGDLETIQILLERKAAKNALDSYGNNMMHYAAMSGNVEIVQLVSSWDYLSGYKKSYFHISIPEAFWAAQSGNLDCLKYMLTNPPNPLPLQTPRPKGPWDDKYPGMYGTNDDLDPLKHYSTRGTILHYGVESGNLPIVQYLIEQGVNPLKSNHIYEYPIHLAASQGNIELVKYLWPICKAKGMQIDDNPENGSLLHRAVKKGNQLELVKYLIQEEASLKCRDCFQKSVLDLVNDPGYTHIEIKDFILSLSLEK